VAVALAIGVGTMAQVEEIEMAELMLFSSLNPKPKG
jgi:hypothetical protein